MKNSIFGQGERGRAEKRKREREADVSIQSAIITGHRHLLSIMNKKIHVHGSRPVTDPDTGAGGAGK